MKAAFSITQAHNETDLADVRDLCWAYRDFLLNHSGTDRDITETFYPTPKYKTLMASLAQEHARPKGVILLARNENGVAIGCGMSHAIDSQTSEIKRVFVTEGARGLGLAKAICKGLMDQARTDGFTRTVLDTSRSLTAAQSLYASIGFQPRGPYQPIPDHALEHLVFFEIAL
jgi:GNAT superfamily N-acetyltransferase